MLVERTVGRIGIAHPLSPGNSCSCSRFLYTTREAARAKSYPLPPTSYTKKTADSSATMVVVATFSVAESCIVKHCPSGVELVSSVALARRPACFTPRYKLPNTVCSRMRKRRIAPFTRPTHTHSLEAPKYLKRHRKNSPLVPPSVLLTAAPCAPTSPAKNARWAREAGVPLDIYHVEQRA